ncbi:MAG: 3-deoxy-manno-octulosonate cytidylyltransferase, partial [Leptospiraceae bacterium]|nr:3-deoxy-manno-octulosonate cytidylyltransferase [Leptospiraceae bacterium]
TMLEWTYLSASKAKLLSELVIATDDERILTDCKRFHAKAILTSIVHPTGTDRVREVVSLYDYESLIVVNIQGDEPDIDPSLIEGVVKLKLENRNWEMTTAAIELSQEDWSNPNKVKVVFNRKQEALYFSRSLIPSQTRGIAKVYRHLGIYCYEKSALLEYPKLPPSELERSESLEQLRALDAGFKIGVYVTDKESLSVDTPEDLEYVRREFQKRGLI